MLQTRRCLCWSAAVTDSGLFTRSSWSNPGYSRIGTLYTTIKTATVSSPQQHVGLFLVEASVKSKETCICAWSSSESKTSATKKTDLKQFSGSDRKKRAAEFAACNKMVTARTAMIPGNAGAGTSEYFPFLNSTGCNQTEWYCSSSVIVLNLLPTRAFSQSFLQTSCLHRLRANIRSRNASKIQPHLFFAANFLKNRPYSDNIYYTAENIKSRLCWCSRP